MDVLNKNDLELKKEQRLFIKGADKVRSYLIKVFWPNFFVGNFFQIFNILMYASGLKIVSALNLNKNPFFEMAYSYNLLFSVLIA